VTSVLLSPTLQCSNDVHITSISRDSAVTLKRCCADCMAIPLADSAPPGDVFRLLRRFVNCRNHRKVTSGLAAHDSDLSVKSILLCYSASALSRRRSRNLRRRAHPPHHISNPCLSRPRFIHSRSRPLALSYIRFSLPALPSLSFPAAKRTP